MLFSSEKFYTNFVKCTRIAWQIHLNAFSFSHTLDGKSICKGEILSMLFWPWKTSIQCIQSACLAKSNIQPKTGWTESRIQISHCQMAPSQIIWHTHAKATVTFKIFFLIINWKTHEWSLMISFRRILILGNVFCAVLPRIDFNEMHRRTD